MKTIYCSGCSTKVAMIADGSKLKKGMVCLCDVCERKRKASDLASKTSGRASDMDWLNGIWNK